MCKILNKPAKLIIEIELARGKPKTLNVEEYLKNFTWDNARF